MIVWQSHLTLRILDSYVTIVFYYDVLDLFESSMSCEKLYSFSFKSSQLFIIL